MPADPTDAREALTKEAAAAMLTGYEYPAREIDGHSAALKAAGLVAVYGQSDDIMAFSGAIRDEVSAYDGGTAHVDSEGLVPTFDAVSDTGDEEQVAAYFRRKPHQRAIEAVWSPEEPAASWLIRTDIPHATFDIVEDGDLYCRGLVFALADLA
jgi:hypothetical protein